MTRRTHRTGRHSPLRPFPRAARVNALVHEVVAEEIERVSDADDRLALVTVTGVECEPDLRHAVVYLASLASGVEEALEEHRRALQATLAGQIHLKRTPQLRFVADPAVAAGNRIEDALRRARRESSTTKPAPLDEEER